MPIQLVFVNSDSGLLIGWECHHIILFLRFCLLPGAAWPPRQLECPNQFIVWLHRDAITGHCPHCNFLAFVTPFTLLHYFDACIST
jgi:hypothetical protein